MRSINEPRPTGKPGQHHGVAGVSDGQRWFEVERAMFADCCTMSAAVIKSLLDRLFFSRFELQNWKKIFVEDFYKEVFFVLVCGPLLLIENFLAPAKPARGAELAALGNKRFLTAII